MGAAFAGSAIASEAIASTTATTSIPAIIRISHFCRSILLPPFC